MDIKNRINGEVYFVTDTVVDWVDIFTRPVQPDLPFIS